VPAQGADPPAWFAAITPDTRAALVDCLAPLAARGQFSKDEGAAQQGAGPGRLSCRRGCGAMWRDVCGGPGLEAGEGD